MHKHRGFSLIELSIVLLITGLLLREAIAPVANLRQTTMRKQTHVQLQAIKRALTGHIIRTGALPCPIPVTHAPDKPVCSLLEGGVPAAELGLLGDINAHGALLDVWGRPLRYVVSQSNHAELGNAAAPDWLTPGDVANIGLSNVTAELRLCLNGMEACKKKQLRADQLVALVISDGEDGGHEFLLSENQDGDTEFLVKAYSTVDGNRYDDILISFSRSDVVYWLLRSHWLFASS